MKLQSYLKTWEATQAENKWGRGVTAGLILIVLLLVIRVFTKETIVTIQPFTLSQEAWITKGNASQSYKEAWGLAFAQLLGNVTPGSVDFVKERLGPLLSPAIYQDVIDAVEIQSKQIKDDRVSMRFEPRSIEYEQATNKVFAYGFSFVKGSSTAQEQRAERTYEFIIEIANYAPTLQYLETYTGKPKSATMLRQLEITKAEQP